MTSAVESVLSQDFKEEDYEIIVVNDSGGPLPAAPWQRSERVKMIQTNRRERSVARNTGAAMARGRYLHFLDDDDWLASGALGNFWKASQAQDGMWIYGVTQLVDRMNRPIIQLRHGLKGNSFLQVMAGEWIPLQASLIHASAFFGVGGFNQVVSGPEDIDLLRRIALVGNLVEVPEVVAYVAVGQEESTTDYDRHPLLSRWARERILDMPDVFNRLRASAGSSYWRGRIVRIYLTSIIWNLKQKRLLTAGSRAVYGLASLGLAGWSIASGDFWQAISRPYASQTFEKGFQEAGVSA